MNIEERKSYLKHRKIPFLKSSQERFKIAQQELSEYYPDYELMLMLFDVALDSADAEWLDLISNVFLHDQSPYYDLDHGITLILKAQELGHAYSGIFIWDDYQRALCGDKTSERNLLIYLDKAPLSLPLGHIFNELERYTGENPPKFEHLSREKRAIKLLALAEHRMLDSNFREPLFISGEFINYSMFHWATFNASGDGVKRNIAKAIKIYEALCFDENSSVKRKSDGAIRFAKRNLLIRAHLEEGFDKTNPKTRALKKAVVQDLIPGGGHAILSLLIIFSESHTNIYQRAKSKVLDIMNASDGITKFYQEDFDKDDDINIALAHYITIVSALANGENWHNAQDWANLLHYTKENILGRNPGEIVNSTLEYGPFYNKIDSFGLPVLGAHNAFNYGSTNSSSLVLNKRRFVEVVGQSDGCLSFRFENDETLPELITDEDVDVAMALVFGYKNTRWPEIDMPNEDIMNLRLKRYDPDWLVNTDFGRTLYITDALAGELSWRHHLFSYSVDTINNPDFDKIKEMFKELDEVKYRHPKKTVAVAVNIHPREVNLSVDRDDDTVSVIFNNASLGIDGGYSIKTWFGVREWKHRNNFRYTHPKKTEILSKHYDEICFAFPVFERLRQLTGLVYSLDTLKNNGFELNDALQNRVNQRRREFETAEKPREKHMARLFPLVRERKVSA